MRINSLQMMPIAQQTNKQTVTRDTTKNVSFSGKIDPDFLLENVVGGIVMAAIVAVAVGVGSLVKSCVNHDKALVVNIFDSNTERLLRDRQSGVNNLYLDKIRPEDVIELKHKYVDEFRWSGEKREAAENYFNDVLVMGYTDPKSQQGANISWDEFDAMKNRMEKKVKQLNGEK